MTPDELAQLLTTHEPRWHGTGYGGGAIHCKCGNQCENGYPQHLTETLTPLLSP